MSKSSAGMALRSTFREIHGYTMVVEADNPEGAVGKVQAAIDQEPDLGEPDSVELDNIEDWDTNVVDDA